MIRITDHIAIDEDEIEEHFILASGSGGQNVNKVAAAVQLRFDVRRSLALPEAVRARLERLAGRRLTREGVLVITARRFRSQAANRQDALRRLVELVRAATIAPIRRRPTKPSAASKRRRLDAKSQRGETKRQRRTPAEE